MAQLLKTNGEIIEITPQNGKRFSIKEAQKLVGGYVELVPLKHRKQLICNEEGIILGMPYNATATEVLRENYGPLVQRLYGDVILCMTKEF